MQKKKFLLCVLIVLVVIGMTTFGWVLGHIVKYSIPAFQHPPLHFPGEKSGEATPLQAHEKIPFMKSNINPVQNCQTTVYYTSLPAKCHTPNGKLVRVESFPQGFILIQGEGELGK